MCGIVGHFSKHPIWEKKLDVFTQMLYANAVRGVDSTGVTAVLRDNSVISYKDVAPAADYLRSDGFRDFIHRVKHRVTGLLGHNRAATIGNVGFDTAHPFTYGPITLVHNGTLFTWRDLPGAKGAVSDSDAIARAFASEGAENIIPLLDGAFALVWYDDRDKTINMTRNDDRPLSFGFDENADNLFFASESTMLRWMATRHRLGIKDILYPVPGHILSFDMSSKKPNEYKSTEVKLKPKSFFTHRQGQSVGKNFGINRAKRVKVNKVLEKFNLKVGDVVRFFAQSHGKQKKAQGLVRLDGITNEVYGNRKLLVQCRDVNSTLPLNKEYEGAIVDIINVGQKLRESLILEDVEIYVEEKKVINLPVPKGPPTHIGGTRAVLPGPKKSILSLKDWNDATKNGCINCGGNIYPYQADFVLWVNGSDPMCPDCVDEWHGQNGYSLH